MDNVEPLSQILTDEESKKKFEELKQIAIVEAEAKKKEAKLSEVLRTKTTGSISLPKPNLNGLAIIMDELGSVDAQNLIQIKNIPTVIWALQNQSNEEVASLSQVDRKKAIFKFGATITMENIGDYLDALLEAFDIQTAQGATKKKTSKRKK